MGITQQNYIDGHSIAPFSQEEQRLAFWPLSNRSQLSLHALGLGNSLKINQYKAEAKIADFGGLNRSFYNAFYKRYTS